MKEKTFVAPALLVGSAMAVAISMAVIATPAAAEGVKGEKCYGVSAAGKNDCQTTPSSCAGSSKVDRQPDAFVYLPAGTCAKIAGGKTVNS